jgi:hypothetical protein
MSECIDDHLASEDDARVTPPHPVDRRASLSFAEHRFLGRDFCLESGDVGLNHRSGDLDNGKRSFDAGSRQDLFHLRLCFVSL